MKIQLYILIGLVLMAIVISLGGCSLKEKHPQRYTGLSPIPIENYDEEVLKANAKELNMRYVDYLHALTNNKIPELRHANTP